MEMGATHIFSIVFQAKSYHALVLVYMDVAEPLTYLLLMLLIM